MHVCVFRYAYICVYASPILMLVLFVLFLSLLTISVYLCISTLYLFIVFITLLFCSVPFHCCCNKKILLRGINKVISCLILSYCWFLGRAHDHINIDKKPVQSFWLEIMLHHLYRKWAVEDMKPLLRALITPSVTHSTSKLFFFFFLYVSPCFI